MTFVPPEFFDQKNLWTYTDLLLHPLVLLFFNYLSLGDLVQQKNPTCWVETYQGGQSCCHHKNFLLDKHQNPPDELLTYQLKFRFYYQTYIPASETTEASHKNLIRMYYQTEAWSSEYDVPQCPPGRSLIKILTNNHCIRK